MDQENKNEEITFVCISDLHSYRIDLPKGDVLIVAGDFSNVGNKEDILEFIEWLNKFPFKHKVVVAGNHEVGLDEANYKYLRHRYHRKVFDNIELKERLKANCCYLENSSAIIEGYKIWGSPYSLLIGPWAFQLKKEDAFKFWQQIEEDSDIVVTHGPPVDHGDKVIATGEEYGDEELLKRILQVKPKYHIFGHVHDAYGITEEGGVKFINCSILDEEYELANQPIIFKLPRKN